MPVEIVRTRTAHEGWTRLLVATIRLETGDEIQREVEDHGDAVAVLPYDPERRRALLIRQLRAPVLFAGGPPAILEAPAGQLDEDDPEDCARREAHEEVGLRLGALEYVAAPYASPGLSTERISLYLAPYTAADRVAEGGGDSSEQIAVVEVALGELDAMLEGGAFADLKTVALVQALRLRHPDLFT